VWNTELNGLLNVYRTQNPNAWLTKLNLIGGLRYFNMEEELHISQVSTIQPGVTSFFSGQQIGGTTLTTVNTGFNSSFTNVIQSPASIVAITDQYDIRNQFYGGQVGAQMGFRHKNFTLDFTGKIAAGYLKEIYRLKGASSLDGGATVPGGLYILSSNLGKF